jgi:signal transduction histidine kinase
LNNASEILPSERPSALRAVPACSHEHAVQFYESDAYLLESLRTFLGQGLRSGESAVVVATGPHRQGLARLLIGDGLDLPGLTAAGRYVSLDSDTLLYAFMRDGMPDAALFDSVVGEVVARAASAGTSVRAFGEMVATLWSEGRHTAAIRLEALWNDLLARYPLALWCGYPLKGFAGRSMEGGFAQVCAEHSRVYPAESYSDTGSESDRLLSIARLQQQTATLEREAQEALRMRNDFLIAASHDLKTPLSVILGYAQMLARDTVDAGSRVSEGLKSIERRARLMAAAVEEMADAGRVEAGDELLLRREMVDLAALATETVTEQQKMAPRHRILLEIEEALLAGFWDQARLSRVLVSLIGNAIKYSPDGGEIVVRLARDGNAALLSVEDTGMGIPGDDLPHIFDRFYRGANVMTATAGTGIGLSTARRIVERHGGTITATSIEGSGSTFVVRLPLAPEPNL